MKTFKLFIYIFILITAFSVSAISQAKDFKIAAINTNAFSDKQTGISEFAEAVEKFETELKAKYDELALMSEKRRKVDYEFMKFSVYHEYPPGSDKIIEKRSNDYKKLETEYKNLITEYKEKEEQLKLLAEKRGSELLTEPEKKIRGAIRQFAKENGFPVILDSSKDLSSVIINCEVVDVTQKFIGFYNKQAETRP